MFSIVQYLGTVQRKKGSAIVVIPRSLVDSWLVGR